MLRAEAITVPRRLRGASLALEPGQVTAIVGPNGAGKSTLLAALAGLLPVAEGMVTLDGSPLTSVVPRARACAIGYLPQARVVAWDIDVRTLVELGRLPWHAGPTADRLAVDAALAAQDLEALAARPVSRLSGGELARALLARVLAGEPRVLLADEPLAALDLAHQQAVLNRLRALAAGGLAIALAVHDLAAARNFADRIVVLDAGEVVEDGPARDALGPERLARTWAVEAEWTGRDGRFALVVR